jgi:hypothetical protein
MRVGILALRWRLSGALLGEGAAQRQGLDGLSVR